MPLTKETRSLLDMAYRVGAPRFHELAVAQARHSAQKLHFAFRPEAPAVASTADTVEKVIAEVAASRITERGATRVDDKFSEAAMEDRKREGYF